MKILKLSLTNVTELILLEHRANVTNVTLKAHKKEEEEEAGLKEQIRAHRELKEGN